jgi:Mn2+/Fe2+ NRAMP family transporter
LLATVLMPPALIFLLIRPNDREIMGTHINSRSTNVLAITITVLVMLAGSASAIVSFAQTFPNHIH